MIDICIIRVAYSGAEPHNIQVDGGPTKHHLIYSKFHRMVYYGNWNKNKLGTDQNKYIFKKWGHGVHPNLGFTCIAEPH